MSYTKTRLRHLSNSNLKILEGLIQALPYRVEIKSVNQVGQNWYVHFTIADNASEPNSFGNSELIAKKKVNKKRSK